MSRHISADYLKAGNPATPAEELERIAATGPAQVIRRRLAENPSTPIGLLSMLGEDEDVDVRIGLGHNPSTPLWLRKKLARDDSPTVRFSLAEDPHTPVSVLKELAEDEHPHVQHQAHRTIEVIEMELALAEEEYVIEDGAGHKLGTLLVAAKLLSQTQVDELLRIATEIGSPLGQALARHRALPKQTITEALILQSKLRRNEITELEAVEALRRSRPPEP